jgi:hypothetical protein
VFTADNDAIVYGILSTKNVDVDDFQFLIRESDGAVFVNDPSSLTFGRSPNVLIRQTIDRLKQLANN